MITRWRPALVGASYLTTSVVVGWYVQPFVESNSDATGIIVNVFSILAGFLVTIMTLLGEPGLYRGRTWRADQLARDGVHRRLVRHKWLFILYLLTLLAVFVATVYTDQHPEGEWRVWFERAFVSLACFAFLLSAGLPKRLMDIQMERYEAYVQARRRGEPPESE